MAWVASLGSLSADLFAQDVIALDGRTARHSGSKATGRGVGKGVGKPALRIG